MCAKKVSESVLYAVPTSSIVTLPTSLSLLPTKVMSENKESPEMCNGPRLLHIVFFDSKINQILLPTGLGTNPTLLPTGTGVRLGLVWLD